MRLISTLIVAAIGLLSCAKTNKQPTNEVLERTANAGLVEHFLARWATDAVNIGQRHFHALIAGQVYTFDTCHSLPSPNPDAAYALGLNKSP